MLDRFVRENYRDYGDFTANFAIRVPDRFNFAFDVVDEWASAEPSKRALVWCDDRGAERTFTFAEVAEASRRAANFFRSIGVRKGDPVMLILKRRYEFWFCILALHRIGAVAIPATHLLKKKDVSYRNNAAGVTAIVAAADEALLAEIDLAAAESPTLRNRVVVGGSRAGWTPFEEGFEKASPVFERPEGGDAPKNGDLMLLYFTSGTTGYPKMVAHDFTYPLGHILTAGFWQRVRNGGLHLTVADTGWAKSAWGKIYGQWIAGAVVFVYDYDKFVPAELLRVISRHRVSTFCAPPTIYRYLIKENLSEFDLSALEYCVVAGEPLNPEVYEQFLRATGIKLMEGYGQTECTVAVATYPWIEPKPGSMGKPSPGYDIDIIDVSSEELRSCAPGDVGEIVIRTDRRTPVGMFTGYHRDGERTRSVWNGGVYHTGDTAWRDEDGYFWFVGRTDDLIKSSGYRIGPFEVESALLEHDAVLECAVTGVPDPVRGQAVKATVVLAKNHAPGEALVRELQEHVKKVTAPYKYPRIIEFVSELPKTISGKIRRVEIREKDRVE
jgi:acetyl-CoA synthetase